MEKCKCCGHDVDLHKTGMQKGSYGHCSVLGCKCTGGFRSSIASRTYEAKATKPEWHFAKPVDGRDKLFEQIEKELVIKFLTTIPLKDLKKLVNMTIEDKGGWFDYTFKIKIDG